MDNSRETTPLFADEPSSFEVESTAPVPEEIKYDLPRIIISLWLGSFLSALDSTVVASTMSGIASEFNDSKNLTWIATSYMLTNTAFQPLYGKTSDVLGRKYCLVFAQFWFGLGCFLCCFSQNITQFAIARAIAGIGGGGLSSLSSIVVSDIVSLQDRGIYQGYANLMYATAQSLGGPIGGLCLQTIGWRWMFGIQAPLTLVCMVLAIKYVNIHSSHFPKPEDRFSKENIMRIDFMGSASLVVSTSSFLFLLSTPKKASSNKLLALTCIIGFLGFIYIENKVAKEPVIPPHLFKGVLGLTAFIALFGTLCYFNILFVVPLYLEVIQDVSPSGAGVYIIFQVVPVALGSLLAGSYLRNIEQGFEMSEVEKNKLIQQRSGKLVVGSLLFELVGLVVIAVVVFTVKPNSSSFIWKFFIVFGLASCGFGIGMLLVALLVLAVAIVGKEGQAAASSMNYLFRSAGQVLGVSIPLSVYNKTLFKNLSSYLKGKPNGESTLKRLLEDNEYLRNGLDADLREPVLNIYKLSASVAYTPGGVAGVVGLALAVCLLFKRK